MSDYAELTRLKEELSVVQSQILEMTKSGVESYALKTGQTEQSTKRIDLKTLYEREKYLKDQIKALEPTVTGGGVGGGILNIVGL